jgi:hypothetical protein
MPGFNAASATRDLVSRPAGAARSAGCKPQDMPPSPARLVWPLASFSDPSVYNFENLQMI